MHDLTEFQRDLLFVIAGLDEPSGLEIKDELEQYYEQNIRHGRLYPNLDTLVNARLVKKGQQDKRTNKYVLVDRGLRELTNHLEWQLQYCPPEVKAEIREALDSEGSPVVTEANKTES